MQCQSPLVCLSQISSDESRIAPVCAPGYAGNLSTRRQFGDKGSMGRSCAWVTASRWQPRTEGRAWIQDSVDGGYGVGDDGGSNSII